MVRSAKHLPDLTTPSAPSAQPPLREIRKVLQAPEFDRLTYISRKSGTHIVQSRREKDRQSDL